ncbi:spermidine/putrescine ABC transporter permease PotC [Pseudodesulfovibrio tunisiensis]|uniref:spermidine/putrescine ABC transporter permease PotC n=1 Tax=Pseudodesulfovibrio tunisiensis TaxID=463192 RepID=UPI001FB461D6|nr:spermidine/putrescine ABC transporter permease PotC [Pseudodesulfovibrio tunisiensis]
MNRFLRLIRLVPVYLFLYVPILVLIGFSFNDSKYSVVWKGFTWKWYSRLLDNTQLMDAALNTLTVAVLAASLATALGVLAAVALHRYRFAGRSAMKAGLFVLMMSPDIVMGVSLLMLFVLLGMAPGFWPLLLAHVTFCLPFVTTTVLSRLKGFDPHLIEAAQDLGAGEFRTFRHVILPLCWPAVLAGWLLSFTLSMDDVIISFFVTGPDFDILPLRIYSMVRMGVKPDVNALSAFMVGLTVILVFTSQLLLRKKK